MPTYYRGADVYIMLVEGHEMQIPPLSSPLLFLISISSNIYLKMTGKMNEIRTYTHIHTHPELSGAVLARCYTNNLYQLSHEVNGPLFSSQSSTERGIRCPVLQWTKKQKQKQTRRPTYSHTHTHTHTHT